MPTAWMCTCAERQGCYYSQPAYERHLTTRKHVLHMIGLAWQQRMDRVYCTLRVRLPRDVVDMVLVHNCIHSRTLSKVRRRNAHMSSR